MPSPRRHRLPNAGCASLTWVDSRGGAVGLEPEAVPEFAAAHSDLHAYLTVPFVLSWSLFNALASGATVLASDTAPVREVIRHEENGLLVDFFDVDGMARLADRVLDDAEAFRHLGRAGMEAIRDTYSLEVSLRQMLKLYERN
jgi:glycosyltransferase involved in cell wall biosynthesis